MPWIKKRQCSVTGVTANVAQYRITFEQNVAKDGEDPEWHPLRRETVDFGIRARDRCYRFITKTITPTPKSKEKIEQSTTA